MARASQLNSSDRRWEIAPPVLQCRSRQNMISYPARDCQSMSVLGNIVGGGVVAGNRDALRMGSLSSYRKVLGMRLGDSCRFGGTRGYEKSESGGCYSRWAEKGRIRGRLRDVCCVTGESLTLRSVNFYLTAIIITESLIPRGKGLRHTPAKVPNSAPSHPPIYICQPSLKSGPAKI